jgi:hypothetical protein
MLDFFNFDTLITPYVIGIIYVLGAISVPILIIYYVKKYKLKINNAKYKIYIIITFLLIETIWRIFCEFFMVYFKIFLLLNTQ